MKIPYEKPAIAIERYELTQAIASCAVKIGFSTSDCVKNDPDAPPAMRDFAKQGFFVDTINCVKVAESYSYEDGICYHTSASLTFNS